MEDMLNINNVGLLLNARLICLPIGELYKLILRPVFELIVTISFTVLLLKTELRQVSGMNTCLDQ